MLQVFSAKNFSKFMKEQRNNYLLECRQINKRDKNTDEEIKLSFFYYPNNFKKYGYYFYNNHLNFWNWSKTKE